MNMVDSHSKTIANIAFELEQFNVNKQIFPFLLQNNAKLGVIDFHFIEVMAKQHDPEVILMAEKFAKISEVDIPWDVILFESLGRSNNILPMVLMDHAFVKPDIINDIGNTPLHSAAYNGLYELLEPILRFGVSLDQKNKYDETALHVASGKGQVEFVRRLLAKGVNVNACNAGGDTPLLIAAYYGHEQVVVLLLDSGANKRIKNKKGWRAAARAKAKGFSSVAVLINQHV
jgi:hypothetical protein